MKISIFIFLFFHVFILNAQQLTDNLLLYYPMNGNLQDLSGNSFDGIPNGPVPTVDRFNNPNGAYFFDGIDDYIDLPIDPALKPNLPVSYSFWIKLVDLDTLHNPIIGSNFYHDNYHGTWVDVRNTGQISANIGLANSCTGSYCRRSKLSTNTLSYNFWNHVVVVIRSGDDMDIIINCEDAGGTYSGNYDPLLSLTYSNDPGKIGVFDRNVYRPPYFFEGSLDEIGYWDRALTQLDVQQLCHGVFTGVNEEEHVFQTSVYPNPVDDIINIETIGKYSTAMVYNVLGEEVMQVPFSNTIDVSQLPVGMYTLRLLGEQTTAVNFVKK